MPNAQTHDILTVITAAGADVAYYAYAPAPQAVLAGLFTVSYLFAGYACAGDLDLDSREYRRWGPLRFIWWPYRAIVPHRSWVSHGLIAGGVIRAGYLAGVCTLLFWLALWLISRLGPHIDAGAETLARWQSLLDFARAHPNESMAMISGFVLAGTTHSVADLIYTGVKRRF